MTNAELLQLDHQHHDELKSFLKGYEFDHVEIVARQQVVPFSDEDTTDSKFFKMLDSLVCGGVFFGDNRTHVFFEKPEGEDNTVYAVSIARIGNYDDRILFKLTF